MGFELLTMLISGQDLSKGQYDESFFGLTDAENISLSLQLPPGQILIHSFIHLYLKKMPANSYLINT